MDRRLPVSRSRASLITALLLAAGALSVAALPPQKIAWQNDCTTSEGWLSNVIDPGVNARVDKTGDSVVRITQDGSGTWGKAAIKVEGIDINETPIIEVKVDKVDLDSAFQVTIAPPDWSEMSVVIKRSSADGIHQGDLRKAIRNADNKAAWNNPEFFWVVVVIEGKGKASWLDYVRIQSER